MNMLLFHDRSYDTHELLRCDTAFGAFDPGIILFTLYAVSYTHLTLPTIA